MTSEWRFEFVSRIADIERSDWQELVNGDNPFISYDYLSALENTGAAGAKTAWRPLHLLAKNNDDQLVAAVPIYAKQDSWGEFVFDFAWANAYHEHGISYYPKLVTAIPYTPVTGPRLLLAPGVPLEILSMLQKQIKQKALEMNASSWHVLFPDQRSIEALAEDVIIRKDCQFHWHNKAYQNFDHYLSTFRSSSRKKTRRERRKILEANVVVTTQSGKDLSNQQWSEYYQLYASTFLRRGREPYLSLAFFIELAGSDQVNILVKWARRDGQPVAVSLFFVSADTLYGRYWGAREFVDGLHFELCYYQGIEFCIEQGLSHFDPGVQGEHKIARGFEATTSWSAHWLQHPEFATAIGDFVAREARHIDDYMQQVDLHTPFRHDPKPPE